jgi:uncharacterized protein YneR
MMEEREGEFTPKRRTNLRYLDKTSQVPDDSIYRIYEANDGTGQYIVSSIDKNGGKNKESVNPEENISLVINTLSDREGRRRRCRPPHGLDMYLKVGKYISKYNYPYNINEGWPPPIDEEYKRLSEFVPTEFDKYGDFSGIEIGYPVGYWRNAIAIHQWFMNLPDDKNAKYLIFVSYRDLKRLNASCKSVLSIRTEEEAKKQGLFPATAHYGGIFFEDPQMDEWYFDDLERTVEITDHILNSFSEADIHIKFTYRASN